MTDFVEDVVGEKFFMEASPGSFQPVPLRCIKCKSRQFEVAQGDYETYIKCPACNYEVCIHSG